MKRIMKRMFAVLMAAALCVGMCVSAFAATSTSSGNGTITITNAAIGEDYAAYKIFSATYNETTQSVAYKIGTEDAWYNLVTSSGLFDLTASEDTDVYYATLKTGKTDSDVLTWLKSGDVANAVKNMTATKSEEASSNTIAWTVPYGYYYVTSSLGTVISVDNNAPNASIVDKNASSPTPGNDDNQIKKIVTGYDSDKTPILADDTTATVGSTVDFQLAISTTNYATTNTTDADGKVTAKTTKIYKYTIVDTPTNLKIDTTSLKVYVGEQLLTTDLYDVTYDETSGKLTVVVKWTDNGAADGTSLYANGAKLVVTYSATVLSAAADSDAKNGASWSYNDGTMSTPEEHDVKTYYFDLTKVDATDSSKTLAGAEFSLYTQESGGTAIELVDEGNGVYRVATTDEINSTNTTTTTTFVTPTSGVVTVKGLANGTYYVEETKAPAGYNKLTARESVKIEDANVTGTTFTVENATGSTLPSTGGIGTTIFYVVGGVLVIGAGVLLITKKRMSK